MGYEITMLIGEVSGVMTENETVKNRHYFQIITTLDMCKTIPGAFEGLVDQRPKKGTPVYIYDQFGNCEDQVTKDRYGDDLIALDPHEVLKMLQKDARLKYRRYRIARELLKAMLTEFTDYKLGIILFGH